MVNERYVPASSNEASRVQLTVFNLTKGTLHRCGYLTPALALLDKVMLS